MRLNNNKKNNTTPKATRKALHDVAVLTRHTVSIHVASGSYRCAEAIAGVVTAGKAAVSSLIRVEFDAVQTLHSVKTKRNK
jgi:hypothetical protein